MTKETDSSGVSMALFVPALLIVMTVALQGLTTRAEFNHRLEVLITQERQQDPIVAQAQTLRAQLESIAGATASLAEQGNQNAILIREQLKNQGVSINPRK